MMRWAIRLALAAALVILFREWKAGNLNDASFWILVSTGVIEGAIFLFLTGQFELFRADVERRAQA